jgi:hypothetical protein
LSGGGGAWGGGALGGGGGGVGVWGGGGWVEAGKQRVWRSRRRRPSPPARRSSLIHPAHAPRLPHSPPAVHQAHRRGQVEGLPEADLRLHEPQRWGGEEWGWECAPCKRVGRLFGGPDRAERPGSTNNRALPRPLQTRPLPPLPPPAYYTETLKFNKKYKVRIAGDSQVGAGAGKSSNRGLPRGRGEEGGAELAAAAAAAGQQQPPNSLRRRVTALRRPLPPLPPPPARAPTTRSASAGSPTTSGPRASSCCTRRWVTWGGLAGPCGPPLTHMAGGPRAHGFRRLPATPSSPLPSRRAPSSATR